MTLYYLGNARSEDQRQMMVALETAELCIFCPSSYTQSSRPEPLLRFAGGTAYKKRVLDQNDSCALLVNEYPYPGTRSHLLVVPKRHVTRITDLSVKEWADLGTLLGSAVQSHDLTDHFGIGIRNGRMEYTGGTIAHLHVHLTQVDPDYRGEPIKLFLSSYPDDPPSSD